MKKILQALVVVLSMCSVITFANEPAKLSAEATDNVYTEDKSSITVSANQPVFIVKLKSNPTTGYTWFLREYDTSLIMPVKHSYQAPQTNAMGASGYELWTFRVKPAGFVVPQQTTMRMVYARPWQGSEGSTQLVFRVTTVASETNKDTK